MSPAPANPSPACATSIRYDNLDRLLGFRVLLVDADPQCNLTSFYLNEKQLDELLGESDDVDGGTIWSAIKPVVDGKGSIKSVDAYKVRENVFLVPGEVLLSDYEEELPAAWTGSFARK